MHISNTVFLCATLIASTVAQNPTTTSLHFTTIPTSLVAGVKQTIGWAGGDGNGVNIILQQGLPSNLQNVPIPPIASGVEGNSTTWTPPKSLPNAGNYALKITQGQDSDNYSGMLQLFGGCSTCPTNAAAAFASASASASSPTSATASSPSPTASSSSKSVPVVPSGPTSGSNSTGSAGTPSNSTTTGSGTNSTVVMGSMANMTMSSTNSTKNSTLSSSAKLHATSSLSSASSSATSSSTSSSSSSSESTSSSTGSSVSPSATTHSGGVTVAASKFALVLCAIIGVFYLG